jgi:enamine deaminase RidA (YjgF/YER057c/UK114 family)
MAEKKVINPDNYRWDPKYSEKAYSLAVERNGLLCVSNLTAEEYDAQRGSYIIKRISTLEQTKVIFEKLGTILESAGYSYQDVVYTVDYALEASMPEYRHTADVRRQAFGGSMPAAVGVLVEGLPKSAALISMNAVAMKGGRDKRAVFPEGTPTWERYKTRTFWPGFFVGDEWFWLSGATGRVYDEASKTERYPEGIKEQAQSVWRHALGQVMKDAGVEPSKVVRVADYVHPAGAAEYTRTHTIRRQALKNDAVAAGALPIQRLLRGEALLEIDATAYLGRDRQVVRVAGWKDAPSGADAVRCGKYVFCSAQVPIARTTGQVVGGGFKRQVEKAYENLQMVLGSAGVSAADVVRTVEWTDPANAYQQDALNEIRRSILGPSLPAVTVVTANQGLPAGANYSIEAWAVKS